MIQEKIIFTKYLNSSDKPSDLIDTCGAGDTIISIIALLLIIFDDDKEYITKCLVFLEKCADCIIHKRGTATIDLFDIVNISKETQYILPQKYLPLMSSINKTMEKTILFTMVALIYYTVVISIF